MTEPKFTDSELRICQERFWKKVNKTDSCWLWIGAKRHGGYGDAWWNGRHFAAHRLTYSWTKGPIPEGLTIDHICRTTSCVNPDHLQAITMRDNILLGSKAQNTHCPQGHPFSDENTFHIKTARSCRICKRVRDNSDWKENGERYRKRKRLQYERDKSTILAKQRERYKRVRGKVLAQQKLYRQRLRSKGDEEGGR